MVSYPPTLHPAAEPVFPGKGVVPEEGANLLFGQSLQNFHENEEIYICHCVTPPPSACFLLLKKATPGIVKGKFNFFFEYIEKRQSSNSQSCSLCLNEIRCLKFVLSEEGEPVSAKHLSFPKVSSLISLNSVTKNIYHYSKRVQTCHHLC